MIENSAEKDFYERHQSLVEVCEIDLKASLQSLQTPGNRYYCVFDFLENAKDLSVLELGFGDPSLFLALSNIFNAAMGNF